MENIGKIFGTNSKVFDYFGMISIAGERIPIVAYRTRGRGGDSLELFIVGEKDLEAVAQGTGIEIERKMERPVHHQKVEVDEIEPLPKEFISDSKERPPKQKPIVDQQSLF